MYFIYDNRNKTSNLLSSGLLNSTNQLVISRRIKTFLFVKTVHTTFTHTYIYIYEFYKDIETSTFLRTTFI